MVSILTIKKLKDKQIKKIVKYFKQEYEIINILDVSSKMDKLVESKTIDDILVICGGDGTIDLFVNSIINVDYKCKIFAYKHGSGNDCARDYKNKMLFELTKDIKNLPTSCINDETYTFINSIGIGVDAVVAKQKNDNKALGINKSYFSIAYKSFKKFNRFSCDIKTESEQLHFDNIWLLCLAKGRYYGGGMKICPKALRSDEYIDLCVIHDLSLLALIFLFPFVFLGIHIHFKKYVTYLKCKSIEVKNSTCTICQRDGESMLNVKNVKINME